MSQLQSSKWATTTALILAAVAPSGCASMHPSASFQEAVSAARDAEIGEMPRAPTQGPSQRHFRFALPTPHSTEGRTLWWLMSFESRENGRICFIKTERNFDTDATNAPDDEKSDLGDYAIEAHASLSGPRRPIFPEAGATHFDSYELLPSTQGDEETGGYELSHRGTVEKQRVGMRYTHIRLCGPAPVISPETQYVTVARRGPAGWGSNPGTTPAVLYIFKLVDPADAPDASRGGSAPMAPG